MTVGKVLPTTALTTHRPFLIRGGKMNVAKVERENGVVFDHDVRHLSLKPQRLLECKPGIRVHVRIQKAVSEREHCFTIEACVVRRGIIRFFDEPVRILDVGYPVFRQPVRSTRLEYNYGGVTAMNGHALLVLFVGWTQRKQDRTMRPCLYMWTNLTISIVQIWTRGIVSQPTPVIRLVGQKARIE